MFYLSDGMTFEVLQSLFLQAHFYIHRSFCPQLDSSNIHPLIVLNADALSFASQLFIGTETNITINKESLMHFLFYEKLFMDFEIQSVSDLFSILFKMEGQTDLEIATSKDLANLSEDSDKPALSLSFADQTWFELSSDCSDEEKEQMIKAEAFIKSCLRHSDK